MTDPGQMPEGAPQPEPAGGPTERPVPQPGVPGPAVYPFPGQPDEAGDAEEEDLLMPGANGAWGDATIAPRPRAVAAEPGTQRLAAVPPPGPTPTEPEYLDIASQQPQPPQPQPQQSQPVQAATPPPAPEPVPAPPVVAAATPPGGVPTPAPAPAPQEQAPPAQPEPAPAEPESAPAAPPPAPVPPAPEPAPAPAPAQEAPSAPPPSPLPGSLPTPPGAWQPIAPAAPEPEAAPVAPEPQAPAPAAETPPRPQAAEPVPAQVEPVPPTAPAPEPVAPEPVAAVPAPRSAPSAPPPPAAEAAPAAPEPAPQQAPAPAPAEHAPEQAPAPAQEPAPAAEQAPAPTPAPESAPAPPEQAPPAPAYPEPEREAVHRLMRERRDIHRGFRPDPIPHDVLLRVLQAAHTAPSVGLSQPWDFLIIRSPETRATVHELVERQREAYASSLPKARAKQFRELGAEAVVQAPVNIVVTADPTRGGRPTLGRPAQPQTAPYSSALAVENLWLAARAEGLGVGWISFFDERELVRALDLPEHLEIVAYLCVGHVDAFPADGEAVDRGPAQRRPLSWVVHEEAYGRRALPGSEPHDLLSETLAEIRPLDAQALGEAWERQKRMTKPAGALGALEVISAQLCGLSRSCPPPLPEPAAVAVFAGDHGVHAQGVTPWPQEVTAQMVGNFLGGGAVCNAFAAQVGAEVCVIDVGVRAELPGATGLVPRKVRPGTGDITEGPAMTRDEALRALEVGIETARDLVAGGNRALLTGEMGIANTTVSAALVAVFTDAEPAEVTGRGTGIDDETHARKVDVVRRALARHEPDATDPLGVLSAVGGLEHAALTGLILGGASLRVPVILDGVSAGAAALVARAIAPEAVSVCIAGHRSAEPGHQAALTALGLRPMVDLDLRLGEGTGALLALPVVQSAARAMREVATFDGAGVTEKS
ncbi:nicotinate-nucleotide--dimethylbenzimidazole phosphoribosyltransferase [Streptomyces radicis]|uniref:Nicotinate-nucleotide--dimethylbenzimidazole phosphoribosyltransferase n=2 Tax=Streptomyces radicis TaxID=1750517 RepID=A0A3A9WT08_9ACTN|nr:nicotinate-nucleotide--dimethylbenzimidazole phosphoribosyltransferase [Streptomyces radicis]RKN27543.1 nicotinate-nucleotide--dimethylbenzimidazole phosphoribosyltransferase [Streptomyces radicis]